jgi:hypothetical protein
MVGTIAYAAVCALTFSGLVTISWAWFATPGLLYLIAWYLDHRQVQVIQETIGAKLRG